MDKELEQLKKEVFQELKEDRLIQETRKINTPKITKQEILNIKDRSQRQQAIKENMNLFE